MARDIPAGRAFIELFLKGDKLDRDMRRMRRRLTRITGIIAGVGAAFTAVGVAAGSVAVAGIIKATNAAGDFAETVSKFETVFGDRANVVRDWAEETAEALGITRQEALATLSSFQDLFVPLGIGADQAEEMSKQLTQLAVDLASFNNMASADVVRDLQAAMTGSSETMKKYGAIVDAAAVKQELLNQGLDPTTATNAEKAIARLNLILASTTAAQGDAIRTADSYNNTLRRMNTTLSETAVDIGQKFMPLMENLARIAKSGLEQLRDAINDNLPDLEGLDEQLVRLAESGSWELAGRIIGTQLKLGIREAVGPGLFDLIEAGARVNVFGLAGQAAFREGRQQLGGLANRTAEAARLGQLGIGGLAAAGAGGFGERRTDELLDELRELRDLAAKQLQEQQRTTQSVEDQEGLRLP